MWQKTVKSTIKYSHLLTIQKKLQKNIYKLLKIAIIYCSSSFDRI